MAAAGPGRLAEAARGAAAAVVSGHAANSWFHEVPDLPCAVDLYDPFPIENLHYARTLGEATARHDHATLELSLSRGDFFLCASAEQRLFYAGALFAAGRIGASNFPEDPALSRLLAVVPFGVPQARPRATARPGGARSASGGPGPSCSSAASTTGTTRSCCSSRGPSGSGPGARGASALLREPQPGDDAAARLRESPGARPRHRPGAAGRSSFRRGCRTPRRADLYAACDLLVSISSEGLETELSYRTRLLDAAWGGVPSVTVGGGSLARELADAGAAVECARDAASAIRRGRGPPRRRSPPRRDVRRRAGLRAGPRRGSASRSRWRPGCGGACRSRAARAAAARRARSRLSRLFR